MTTPTYFFLKAKRVTSALVCASMLATSVLPGIAAAGALKVGSSTVTYPDMDWSVAGSSGTSGAGGSGNAVETNMLVSLGNRTALAGGLTAAEAASPISLFPGNVPVVFGRYNPFERVLRVDVYKLEKTAGAGGEKANFMHALFTPAHGAAWQASRSYISPSQYQTGSIPGINPFSQFGGNFYFENITLGGAQVVMGHAVRFVGAGSAVLAMADSRVSSVTKKSGNWFKKKITTTVSGHIKTRWYLAMPGDAVRPPSWSKQVAFCADGSSSCPGYRTAVSGVTWEEVEGGGFDSTEDTWVLDVLKKSGFTMLGGFVIGSLGVFGLVGAPPDPIFGGLLGAYFLGTKLTAPTTPSATGGTVMDPAYSQVANGGLGGATIGSVIDTNVGALNGGSTTVTASGAPPALTTYQTKLMGYMPSVIGDPASETLKGFNDAAFGAKGLVPSASRFVESNQVQFVRDSNGGVIRDLGGR